MLNPAVGLHDVVYGKDGLLFTKNLKFLDYLFFITLATDGGLSFRLNKLYIIERLINIFVL